MARLQLDLPDTSMELIEKLRVLCDLSTKKDVIENALMLLGWAATEASNGRSIAAVDESKKVYREIYTPALEAAKAKLGRAPSGRRSEGQETKGSMESREGGITAPSSKSSRSSRSSRGTPAKWEF